MLGGPAAVAPGDCFEFRSPDMGEDDFSFRPALPLLEVEGDRDCFEFESLSTWEGTEEVGDALPALPEEWSLSDGEDLPIPLLCRF